MKSKWTREVPKKEGWYWVCNPFMFEPVPCVLQIVIRDGLTHFMLSTGKSQLVSDGWAYLPIEKPRVPKYIPS